MESAGGVLLTALLRFERLTAHSVDPADEIGLVRL